VRTFLKKQLANALGDAGRVICGRAFSRCRAKDSPEALRARVVTGTAGNRKLVARNTQNEDA
jgi:hypothetical protein